MVGRAAGWAVEGKATKPDDDEVVEVSMKVRQPLRCSDSSWNLPLCCMQVAALHRKHLLTEGALSTGGSMPFFHSRFLR